LNSPSAPLTAPVPLARVIPRSEHPISRSRISPNALRVLSRLKDAGYQGFLVGGCVRDLLLGLTPKDFDVATNALPEEVRKLFRNCRLVGRRFRLAHVFFGREIIEVATFRAAGAPPLGAEPLGDLDPEEGEGPEISEPEEFDADVADATGEDSHVLDEHGRILRDNAYGTIDDDVWRRDFTANALYYNIADFSIWDYVGGFEDVLARRLRVIGDPASRYREDPVRMLRAARFEAKLGFELDAGAAAPLVDLAPLLAGAPPARLFDETLKLFLTGHGVQSFAVLRRRCLLATLFPDLAAYLESHPGSVVEQMLVRGLDNTDSRVRADKPVTPTFLFALLLYGPIVSRIEALPPDRWHDPMAIMEACDAAARALQSRVAVPRRFALGVREMFALQPRLEQPRGRRALRLLEHPRLRAAYDLLLLRAEFGLAAPDVADWWTRLQAASPEQRGKMADALAQSQGAQGGGATRGPRRRRRGGRGRAAKPAG
jgi:poly(A) polymerase